MNKEKIMEDLVYRQNNIDKIKQLEEELNDGMYDDNPLIDLVLYYKREIEEIKQEKENMADNYTKCIKERDSKIDKTIEYMKHYIKVEERKYNDNVMKEFEFVIKLLKGSGVDE